jgi:dCTP deaminase
MLLPDWIVQRDVPITPFAEGISRPGVISYGLSSYGYDLRLGNLFKIFRRPPWWKRLARRLAGRQTVVDPKNFDRGVCTTIRSVINPVVIPPHGFALAESHEMLEIPADCIGLVVDKSSYRRCGILMGATVLEPMWRGVVTLEITNATPLPAVVYPGEGIAQCLFLRGEAQCLVNYADKKGRYQDQEGLTFPFIPTGAPPGAPTTPR